MFAGLPLGDRINTSSIVGFVQSAYRAFALGEVHVLPARFHGADQLVPNDELATVHQRVDVPVAEHVLRRQGRDDDGLRAERRPAGLDRVHRGAVGRRDVDPRVEGELLLAVA
jgi:hypothetical protein